MPSSSSSTSSSHRSRRTASNVPSASSSSSSRSAAPSSRSTRSSRSTAPSSAGSTHSTTTSYASTLNENNPLFARYEHLTTQPRAASALELLRRAASAVKPLMRKRGWHVGTLAEFFPVTEPRLLGLNINHGEKICVRLRYNSSPDAFMPFEQVVDTLLHELAHIVYGPHDAAFHRLWDELRDEHEVLLRKGYTGEGFLSAGQRLGGNNGGRRAPPPDELRRLARANAEKRRQQGTLGAGSGQRLGGAPIHVGSNQDIRQIIADQVTRRNATSKGSCASGTSAAETLSQVSANSTFTTQAEEDDANDRAIAQALLELMQEEEEQRLMAGGLQGKEGLRWDKERGLYDAGSTVSGTSAPGAQQPTEEEQLEWALKESMRNGEEHASQAPSSHSKARSTTSASQASPGKSVAALVDKSSTIKSTASQRAYAPSTVSTTASSYTSRDSRRESSKSSSVIDLTSNTPTAPQKQDLGLPIVGDEWVCQICTCINPLQFLACDACGTERAGAVSRPSTTDRNSQAAARAPQPKSQTRSRWEVPEPREPASLGWNCGRCGSFMEHKWWTCSACGQMKESS